jgi:hypothetical protein
LLSEHRIVEGMGVRAVGPEVGHVDVAILAGRRLQGLEIQLQ